MTQVEKIQMVQSLVESDPEATTAVVTVYLNLAIEKMLRRLYPFNPEITEVPSAYDVTQCELAARLFLRRGGEGESRHSENGIDRTYGSVGDEDILKRLTPRCKIVWEEEDDDDDEEEDDE